jgi:hypothetical protein
LPARGPTLKGALVIAAVIVVLTATQARVLAAPVFYVLIVDQLSLEDLLEPEFPGISRLLDEGGLGLMNTATAGATTPENAAVTIGAGSRALGPASAGQAFDRDTTLALPAVLYSGPETFVPVAWSPERSARPPETTAAQVYQRRTGRPMDGKVCNLSITEINSANRSSNHEAVPGSLGSALAAAGVEVRYYGNADTHTPKRHMTAVFMDRRGIIAEGSVDAPILDDAESAFGIRTDYGYLQALVVGGTTEGGRPDGSADSRSSEGEDGRQDVSEGGGQAVSGGSVLNASVESGLNASDTGSQNAKGSVVVFDVGDLARLYDANLSYAEKTVAAMRHRIVERLDGLVGAIMDHATDGDRLMVLAPTPARHQVAAGNSFTPLLLWQMGAKPGILTSATTKRKGIVANLDVAPTILAAFGVTAPECIRGHKLEVIESDDSAGFLVALAESSVATNLQRRVILHPVVSAYIVLYLATLLYIVLRPGFAWVNRALQVLLPMMMSMPLALLILPLFGVAESLPALGLALALALGLSVLANYPVKNTLWPVSVISLTTVLAILTDAYTGSRLIQNSVLGYDPMAGARFYGIGNEYMGVLVGATIMGTSSLLDIFPRLEQRLRRASLAFSALVLFTIALPALGANVGGGITASISLSVTLLLLYRTELTGRRVVLILGASALVIVASTLFDLYLNPGGPSHLGRAVEMVDANGLSEALSIIRRKALMNLKLFRYSVWSRAFVVALAVLAWLLYRPTPLMLRIKQMYPRAVIGLAGTIVGALVALIVNDSGVVAGALVLHYATSTVLFLSVRLVSNSEPTR